MIDGEMGGGTWRWDAEVGRGDDIVTVDRDDDNDDDMLCSGRLVVR